MVQKMSDPVTHAEIEDVLSSIRRLVSDDNRSQPAAPEPAARLVLTPALRVQEAEAGGSTAPAAVPDAGDVPLAAETTEAAEDSSEAENQDDADLAGIPDTLAEDPPIAFRHRSSHDMAAPAEQAEPAEESLPEEGLQEAPTEAEAADAPWADPKATLYAAAADAARADDSLEGSGTDAADGAGPEAVTAGSRAASVVRKIAELEARGTRAEDTGQQHWEPDSQTEAPFASAGPDTIEWRDAPLPPRRSMQDGGTQPAAGTQDEAGSAAAIASGEIQAEAEDEAAETVVEAAFTGAALETLGEAGDTYLDEEALRDLVAGIVREELQGPLGERITRNVRKLVRREIHRALAAHDLL